VLEEVLKVQGVEAASPFLYSQVMVNYMGNSSGALLYGVDPEGINRVLDLSPMLRGGNLLALQGKGVPKAILGIELAYKLGIRQGDFVTIISPEGKRTPMGRAPNVEKFEVAGFFESGMYEYDLTMVYVSMKDAQEFLGLEGVASGIQVRTKEFKNADQVARGINERLGSGYWTKDWQRMNKNLFAALELEKFTMFVILTMIVLVGSLNIISGLVMTVMEKKKAIAILRAMGTSKRSISKIFVFQGLIQGVTGVVMGTCLGLLICLILRKYQFISLPKDVYPLNTLPVSVQVMDIFMVAGAALMLALLAAIYPAVQASRQDPLVVIRSE
jgi:lipoprotein-releasing system permease protein